MGKRTLILVVLVLAFVLVGAVGVYAYDASRDDTIAEGVSVAGVDVGGLSAAEARRRVAERVAAPLERPIAVSYRRRKFNLSAEDAGLHADVEGMVDAALDESRSGNFVSRAFRDLTGGEEDVALSAQVTYSRTAVANLVGRVRRGLDRPARDARVSFPSLAEVKEENGLKVDAGDLRRRVEAALTSPDRRTVAPSVSVTRAKVTRSELAQKYPSVLVVDRANFRLRHYRNLKLAKDYTVAIGALGFSTPAGLYHIQNKAVNPSWHVPNSAWAGKLAGTVVPPGPSNPIKARWMGIFAGAGIHGTDAVSSLGTAASHGCVRMAIPDVIALYPQVSVGTPIYIG